MNLLDRLEHLFNSELARRLLIKHFSERGFAENFDRRVYPPAMQDLIDTIPEFNGKIELVPHAIEIDPTNGFARIGWNLFVLGNQRMYLGETEHSDLQDLARKLDSGTYIIGGEGEQTARQQRTAREIISFISRVLQKSEAGLIRLGVQQRPMRRGMGGTASGGFCERPKAIRPEGGSQF